LNLETVADNNPGCVFILTLRDPEAVAASAIEKQSRLRPDKTTDPVDVSVRGYNKVLKKARQFVERRDQPLLIAETESFYTEPAEYEPLLSKALGLEMSRTVRFWEEENARFQALREERPITEEQKNRVLRGIDYQTLEWLRAYGLGQRRAAALST
jgi:hypothetical protein